MINTTYFYESAQFTKAIAKSTFDTLADVLKTVGMIPFYLLTNLMVLISYLIIQVSLSVTIVLALLIAGYSLFLGFHDGLVAVNDVLRYGMNYVRSYNMVHHTSEIASQTVSHYAHSFGDKAHNFGVFAQGLFQQVSRVAVDKADQVKALAQSDFNQAMIDAEFYSQGIRSQINQFVSYLTGTNCFNPFPFTR